MRNSGLSLLLALSLISGITISASPGQILFHSDFERGETHLAKSIKPGQKRIKLIPNFRLQEWPADGGHGIIEGNLPGRREEFQYQHRLGNLLELATPIQKPHPRFADIRTGNLQEWTAQIRREKGDAVVASDNPLFGSYSAEIMKGGKPVQLRKYLPLDLAEYHARFYVRFSEKFLARQILEIPLAHFQIGDPLLERVHIRKVSPQKPAFMVLEGKSTNIIRNETGADTVFLLPESLYCVEHHAALISPDQGVFTLRVNGLRQCRRLAKLARDHDDSTANFRIGKLGAVLSDGSFWIDEIAISESSIGTIPQRPTIRMSGQTLAGSSFRNAGNTSAHMASQWQINQVNAWLTPLWNSGEDKSHLRSFPVPLAEVFTGQVNRTIALAGTLRVPTGIKHGRQYLARVRYRGPSRNWSEWSLPLQFETAKEPAEGIRSTKDLPEIADAFFSHIGKKRKLKTIRRGVWYDFHIHASSPEMNNLAYIEVYFSGNPESNLSNLRNRGFFDPATDYTVSISIRKPAKVFVKEGRAKDPMQWIGSEKRLYCDNSQDQFRLDPKTGRAQIRVRMMDSARIGPWTLNAHVWTETNKVSQTCSRLFFVVRPETDQTAGPGSLILAVAASAILGTIALFSFYRMQKLQKQLVRTGKMTHGAPPEHAGKNRDSLQSRIPHDENIQKAITFIRQNYARPISQSDIASAIGVTPNWLSILFRRETNETVMHHLNRIRIAHAQDSLQNTSMNVTQIAYSVGFNSLRNFNKAFKKIAKTTPLEYRKAFRPFQ